MAAPKSDVFYDLLAQADKTFRKLPLSMRLQIEKISQGLTEFGPRKLRRRGMGTEFFESRDFRRDSDDPRKINARLSARAGKSVVVEKEAEIRQHFYLWRDPSASMDHSSRRDLYTKKEAAEIMLLAFAKHLARNEELIGILDRKGVYRGGHAPGVLAEQMMDVVVMTGDMPSIGRRLPQHSTAVLFSDFLMSRDDILKGLDSISGAGLKGFLVAVYDPQELDFRFKGHIEFSGLEKEGKLKFPKAEAMRDAYRREMDSHIAWLENTCKSKGFKLIIQRTDEPLHKGLLAIYGMTPQSPAQSPSPGPA